jgi:hypothetical protein
MALHMFFSGQKFSATDIGGIVIPGTAWALFMGLLQTSEEFRS